MTPILSYPVLTVLGVLSAGLCLVSMLVIVCRPYWQEDRYREFYDRTSSLWPMLFLFAGVLLAPEWISLLLLCFVSFLAFKEYAGLTCKRAEDRGALFWAYLTIPVQFVLIGLGYYSTFLVFIPIYALLLITVRLILSGRTDGFIQAVSTMYWGLIITVFGLGHLAAFHTLEAAAPVSSASMLLYVVLLTGINDAAQYFIGRKFGISPVAEEVSPNKTREGLVGGVVVTLLVSLLLGPWLTPMGLILSAIAGVLIAISGFFGDLSISAFKRDLGIKDTGNLLPGHGGLLDRVDSLTFTAPLLFHFIRILCF